MLGRDELREYVRGSLWVLPTLSVLAALAAGAVLSSIRIGSRSPLAFQGTPDDARTLLLGITGTMITVIALLLAPDPQDFTRILDAGVRIGFERTLEQDAAFGIRQLVDVACKALSPAV